MTTFVQFHLLVPYPPSNPNRDDQGRPKQAMFGGHPRLRLSSQSLKRAVRESDKFAEGLKGNLGVRSKRFGVELAERLRNKHPSATPERLAEVANAIQRAFANLDTEKAKKDAVSGKAEAVAGMMLGTTLAFVSPEEWGAAEALALRMLTEGKPPMPKEIAELLLRRADGAVDIAMFGRMLTDEKDDNKIVVPRAGFSREAAVQVAHAFTTHRALAEDDWYSAVDDLKTREEDAGAGHIGEAGFGSGVYYLYACANVDLLVQNLGGDRALAAKGLEALARALATATPRGKQNSHAHHPLARHIRAERGRRQPRDLSGAFFHPVNLRLQELKSNDLMRASVTALEEMAAKLDRAYGPAAEAVAVMDVDREEGSLDEIARFAAEAVDLPAPADA